MKYIRTKDGKIYKVSQGIFGEYPIDKEGNVLKMPFAKRDIVKQADTIEELRDVIVEDRNIENELELIKRQQPEIIDGFPTGNIYIGVTKEELTELEQELKEHEQYKAIEKELGVDLKILLKAFKKVDDYYNKNEVVYMKSHDGEIFAVKGISLHYCPCSFFITPNYDREGKSQFMTYWLKDYGKTWALTREELE